MTGVEPMKKHMLPELLLTFMKIGLFTFGGGYAMIPMIEDNCVEKKKWISHDDMMNITVISESTPGPIAINCATFVGYRQAGILGALISTLGIVLPSFVVIYAISMFLDDFLEITVIANAFKGINIAVGILILDAAFTMVKKMRKTVLAYAFMIGAFVCMLFVNIYSWRFSSIKLMLIAASVSLILFLIGGEPKQKGGEGR